MSARRDPAIVPVFGDRAFALDAGTIAAVSVAICVAADRLVLMTVLVPSLLVARLALWTRLPRRERGLGLGAEGMLLALCTGLGAFNDWNSVVRHRIYDYTVPHFFPGFSTIPLWMLLYWGMILRFLVTLSRWQRLAPARAPRNDVRLGRRVVESGVAKVLIQLALILATRQAIYRFYLDPVWSWLPFALALGAHLALFRPDRHDVALLGFFAIGGPAIEILYIQIAELHLYRLGWLAGVPLWIALWWLVAVLIWKDLSARLLARLSRAERAKGQPLARRSLARRTSGESSLAMPASAMPRKGSGSRSDSTW